MSHILAALLLGVLALLGGTPATAANALPVPGPGGRLVAGSAAHAAAPDTPASGPSVADPPPAGGGQQGPSRRHPPRLPGGHGPAAVH
ncbi:hypothetical protein AB0K87_33390, partial [Streptomyces sp. NPDC053705]